MMSNLPRARIMVVEDENIVALDIRRSLEKLGYVVPAVVATGEEAIVYATAEQPDLVLMDIRLRGELDGIQAADEIRAALNIPVVYLTAYADGHTLERAKITEPYGYILKPFDPRELHTVIEMSLYRHRMEQRLRENEQWLQTTLHSIADAVVATDDQGTICFLNPMAEALTGFSADEALGRPLQEVIRVVGASRAPLSSSLGIRLLDPRTYHDAMLLSRKGREIHIEGSAAHLREGNRITGIVIVFRDISEQKRVEAALRQSEQRYRDLFEQAQMALLKTEVHNQINRALISSINVEDVLQAVVDGVARALSLNHTYLHLINPNTKRIERSVRNRSYSEPDLPPFLDGIEFWQDLLKPIQAEPRPQRFVATRVDPDGPGALLLEKWRKAVVGDVRAALRITGESCGDVECLAVVPIIYRGDTLGVLAAVCLPGESLEERDVELMMVIANQAAVAIENARLYEEAERRAHELSRSNAELEQFAYVASHDLQEPLRMIRSYAQILARRQERSDREIDEFVAYILAGVDRLHNLIEDLLAYSRVGVRAAPPSPVSVEAVLKQVLRDLAPAIREVGGSITHDPLPEISVNATQFGQLLQNLIGNALKFHSSRPPRVHIAAREEGDRWQFAVSDNGIGIPEEHLDEIFRVFRRLHTHDEYPGTGIGLAICRKIVEAHGGEMWAESHLGQGSTFYFTIRER